MKLIRLALPLCCILLACPKPEAQPLALASAGSTRAFKIVKEQGDIHVYERWFEVEGENRETRELKAEFEAPAGLDEILPLIREPEKAARWMNAASEVKAVGSQSGPQWSSYIRYNLPWPLNDQDCVMCYHLIREGGRTLVYFRSVADSRVPPKDGVKRLEGVQGLWKLQPLSPGRTKVTYSMLTLEKPTMPRWVTDPAVRANVMDSMAAFLGLMSE